MRRLVAAAALPVLLLAGCGGGDAGSGPPTINWYVFNEPGGAFEQAVRDCTKKADGRYRIAYVRLPTDANAQRELVVRRLAAKDDDIDLVGMDVNWTAEFAEAGWIREWTGENARAAREGVIAGPLETAMYDGRLWAATANSNTQLLWYRKDRVDEPPDTWREMIETAEKLGEKGTIQVQGARYEGLTVWFNSLTASAGGRIVDADGNVELGRPAVEAARVMRRLARSPAADDSLSNNKEDQARLGFESGNSTFQLNYPFVYASAAEKGKEFQRKMGWAAWPRVDAGEPSHVTLGGINIGVSAYSRNPEQAFDAALCLRSRENQIVAAQKGGLPPTLEALYDEPEVRKVYPFADLLKESLERGVPRPVTPAYSDISLAVQDTLHPPRSIEPRESIASLEDKLEKAVDGGIF